MPPREAGQTLGFPLHFRVDGAVFRRADGPTPSLVPENRMLKALLFSLALAALAAAPAAAQAPLAAEGCVACHGPAGSGQGSIPALAGRDANELAAAMRAFRANERPGTIMGRIARGYSDAEIAAIAAYFAQQR
jgi:sulfide dehydrogenase cytochrome subunit